MLVIPTGRFRKHVEARNPATIDGEPCLASPRFTLPKGSRLRVPDPDAGRDTELTTCEDYEAVLIRKL